MRVVVYVPESLFPLESDIGLDSRGINFRADLFDLNGI